MRNSVASLLALAATASATIKGFNYGSTFTTGVAKQQADFEAEFTTAQGLVGADGFTSARLYTMVQANTANDPILAIPAAIKTKTSLLLGLWASGGDASFQNELTALTNAIQKYGSDFTSIVDGISVGSEDLYRNSPMGIAAGSFVGANPQTITNYISSVRKALAGTALSGAQIGHVDTWTAWVNGSNSAVAAACDWIGVDAYPYFQDTMVNDISQGGSLFNDAIGQTQNAVGGKPIWVTETGWPVSGKTAGQALPSVENAKNYWDVVGCGTLFGKVNTWWFTLQDAAPATPNPSFGLIGSTLTTTPLFDLSCKDVKPVSSSSSSPSSSAKASTTLVQSATTGGSSAGSAQTTAATTSVVDTSGSPGIGGSGFSSQISFEATATSGTALVSNPTASVTGTGAGSSSPNSTVTTKAPTTSSTTVPGSSASGLQSGASGAAFLAIMVAILAL